MSESVNVFTSVPYMRDSSFGDPDALGLSPLIHLPF